MVNEEIKDQVLPTEEIAPVVEDTESVPEEAMPSEKAIMDENIDEAASPEEIPDDSNIAAYFPDVEVTPENRAELADAATKLAEHEIMAPKFERMKEQNRKWISVLADDQALAQAINDTVNGGNFWANAAKYVDFNSIAPAEGEPEYENVQRRLDNLSAMEAQQKQDAEMAAMFAENEQKSGELVDQFITDKGYTPEQTTQFLDELGDHLDSFYKRTFSPRMLEAIHKSIVWDTEMGNATEIGKEIGKAEIGNKRIDDLKEKELASETGDGMPDLMGVGMKEKVVKPQSYKEKFLDGVI
jgi:hypothetical protein